MKECFNVCYKINTTNLPDDPYYTVAHIYPADDLEKITFKVSFNAGFIMVVGEMFSYRFINP